jgi:hypothetical protein
MKMSWLGTAGDFDDVIGVAVEVADDDADVVELAAVVSVAENCRLWVRIPAWL